MLAKAPFFKDLPTEDLTAINKLFNAGHFSLGDVIYYEEEPATRLRVVVSGKIKLMRQTLEGKNVLIDVLKPGEFFGTLSNLGDDTYTETAITQTHSCILSIHAKDFRRILNEYPLVTLKVLDLTADRLKASRDNLLELSTLPVEKRIASIMLKLSKKFGEANDVGLLIQMPLTRKDLADMAATSTETASRVMSQFKKDGIIDAGRQWVAITGKKQLAQAVDR